MLVTGGLEVEGFRVDAVRAGLSMALLLYLRDLAMPKMGGAILLSPWTDLTASLGSWDSNSVRPFLFSFVLVLTAWNSTSTTSSEQERTRSWILFTSISHPTTTRTSPIPT